MERSWVVAELTSAGERLARSGDLEGYLNSIFKGKAEYFIPYATFTHLNKSSLINVMEGYFFVDYVLEDFRYLSLIGTRYVKNILHDGTGRGATLLTVRNEKVLELQTRLSSMIASELRVGMSVKVSKGALKGLAGDIVSFDGDYAQIMIELRTLKAIRTVLRFTLTPTPEEGCTATPEEG